MRLRCAPQSTDYANRESVMNDSMQRVLNQFKLHKSKGITHQCFPVGFALRSRIADLRATGYKIVTKLEDNTSNSGRHARYHLIATPEAK